MKGLCEKWSLDIVMKENDDDLLTVYTYNMNVICKKNFEDSSTELIRIIYA